MNTIAVPYDNGQVNQHFGHSEQFKIYVAEKDKDITSRIVETNGTGHSAIVDFLVSLGVTTVICGGIGEEAQKALAKHQIELCAGVTGSADEAVETYLRGELDSVVPECDCDENGEGCGEDCPSDCGEGCPGCHKLPPITGKNVGKKVRTHYRGTFNDGTQFDSSYDRGEPLEFICGAGMMIRGFDAAVANMELGETVNVHLMPAEAYGEYNPNAVFDVTIANMPGSEKLEVGQQVYLRDMAGRSFRVKVTAKDDTKITFDANHEMAGKELNFAIELVEILE